MAWAGAEAERSPEEAGGPDQAARGPPRGQVCSGDHEQAGADPGDGEEGAGRHRGDPSSGISDRLPDQDCLCVSRSHEVCDEGRGHVIAEEVPERNSSVVVNVVTEQEFWMFQECHPPLQPCHKAF